MGSKTASLRTSLAELLEQARQTAKTAGAYTEAGSVGGETSHPIKSVDDNAGASQEGARSRENTEDVKKDQGPAGVESAPTGTKPQEESQEHIGPLDAKSTGKDPASETESVKGDKDDPGTSHPAKTEDGKKFGSVTEELRYLTSQSEKIGQAILTHLLRDGEKTAQPRSQPKPQPQSQSQQQAAEKAAQAGYDLAGLLADVDVPLEDKVACDRFVFDASRRAVEAGVKRAEAYLQVAQGFFGAKRAEDEEGEPHAEEEEPGEESSEEPRGDEEGGQESGGDPALGDDSMPSEEELLAMLAGGGGGGELGAGGGGGDPMGGGMPPGGDPMMGGGVPPGGDPMGGGMPPGGDPMGGGGGGEEAIDPAMLMQILQSLGVDPAMLEGKAAAALRNKKIAKSDKNASLRRRVAAMVLELVG